MPSLAAATPRGRRVLLAAAAVLACSAATARAQQATRPAGAASRPLAAWTRGATCYEVFVRSFYDSDGDGIGDLRGLTEKLDYINDGNPRTHRDLGARCIWIMPVMESPSYHGYDVTDYYRVNHQYGTNDDFKKLVAAAHRRGIKVLVDMVPNHSSSQHPWFQAALRDTTSPYRSWYRWSSTRGAPNKWGNYYWHKSPVRDEYYYGLFSPGMPDLNYRTPAVLEEMKKIATFWVKEMGVDGFRLDAVRHLVEEGDQTENVPATHDVLREYGAHVRRIAPESYTVGEVYDSLGAVIPYYPDQLDSYFAFEVADSIVAAVRTGSARGMLAPMLRLQDTIPFDRWSPFLRNHDQTRTRTAIGGSMARAKVAALILLTMPGLPFVYYGEEIGMTGDKPDPRLRTPMQWTSGHADGFTRGTPWEQLASDSATVTVAAQDHDPASLLNLYRRLIPLRADTPALAGGRLVPLTASSDAVAAYVRRDGDRAVLVVANLGDARLQGVSLSSEAGALPPGRWTMRSLLGGAPAATLTVGARGKVDGYVPLPALAPTEGYLFELSAATARRAGGR